MEFRPQDNPNHMVNLQLKMQAIEQMEKLGNVWIGPDIAIEQKIVIPPNGTAVKVNLTISKSDLPPIEIDRGTFSALRWSVRSCHAQSGTDIHFHHTNLSDQAIKDIREGKKANIPVDITNALARPIELEGNIMRFFWVNDFKRLRRGKLREVIDNKDLIIDGVEGKDWHFGDATEGIDQEKYLKESKDLCIVLRLKEKFYIPKTSEILKINSKKDLDSVLKEIPKGKQPHFSIGETAKVKLGKDLVAVLVTSGYPKGMHLHSPLIDPGFEGPIRTETLFGLKELDVYVYRK